MSFFLGGQRFAGAQLLEHVVHAGQRQVGVLGLLALAVGVDAFGERGDACALLGRARGEGEGLESSVVLVRRPIFQRATGAQRPEAHARARQHAEEKGIVREQIARACDRAERPWLTN